MAPPNPHRAGCRHPRHEGLAQQASSTDQRSVLHEYAYDLLGRKTADAVTTLPAGVDGTIRRIEWGYDDLGRVSKITSFSAASGGTTMNDIAFAYDGWGNVISSKQEHDHAVDAYTRQVQYTYADGLSRRLVRIRQGASFLARNRVMSAFQD